MVTDWTNYNWLQSDYESRIKEVIEMTKLDPIIEFREDHRKVRDSLLDLANAAETGDVDKTRDTLG